MSKNNSWHKGYGFALVLFLVSVLLTGCPGTTPPPKTFTIGGTVAGLTGTGLVLQNNGGNNLSISANATSFTFAMAIVSGTAYNVTVVTQPTSPAQTCTVTNAAGTVADVNITNVAVNCVTDALPSFTIGGTVSGLAGTGLVLRNNGGDNFATSTDGSFTFATAIASGAAYNVTVFTQPTSPAQTCTVTNAAGTVADVNITNVAVACVTDAPPPPSSLSRLFFSGSIHAIDPDHPTSPIEVESATTTGATAIPFGEWDAVNQRLDNVHIETIIYAKGGSLFKVSALKSATLPLVPIQVSNETEATDICTFHTGFDLADPNNSVYDYQLPGPDKICDNEDDVRRLVRLGMTATDTPVVLPHDGEVKELRDPSTGAIIGFLLIDPTDPTAKKVSRCDQDISVCNEVITFADSAHLREGHVGPFTLDFVMIQVDDKLRSYNVSDNTLSGPLYTFTGSDPSSFVSDEEDGTNHYFSDGASLLKVPRDGSSTATLLIQDPAPITGVFITTGRVVYTAGEFSTSTTFTIKSISTGGGSATTLVESTEDFLDVVDGTQGDFVYYNRFPLLGGPPVAGTIKDDGSSLSEIPNAIWSGVSVKTSLAFTGGFVDRIVLIGGCDQNFVCSTVKTVLADTNSDEVSLGKLPSDIGFASFFGIGDDILGQGEIFATGSGDILYGRASVPDSLIRVTDTADRDEEVISVGDSD